MIRSNLVNQANGCKAIVTWQFDSKEKHVSNLCQNEQLAIAFCEKSIRKLIIDTLTKFINHRSYIEVNCNRQVQSSSLVKLKMLTGLLPSMTLMGVCKSVAIYENDLLASLPGPNSKYYHHDSLTIKGLIQDCKSILNNQKVIA